MTENEAREWIIDRFGVSRETKLAEFTRIIADQAKAQNLIARSTLDQLWSRHIVDSAQLLSYGSVEGDWIDVGSGAGLPGLVLAILNKCPIELIEPRRLRTTFLENAAAQLQLSNVTVTTAKVERTAGHAHVIVARAVTNLDALFAAAHHRSTRDTVWILPKGRNAQIEVEVARHSWQGSFHVEQSITASDSYIVVAQGVRRK